MRYSVLTYIFGGYEVVHEVLVKDPDAEYILVTDDRNLRSDTWKVVIDENLDGLSPFEKCYQVRFHPFEYVNTGIVVRVDGSMIIKESLAPLIDIFEDYDMCLMIHPERDNIPDEYATWIRHRNYPEDQAKRCMYFMETYGYDWDYRGLFQLGFCIQRNDITTNSVNYFTYSLLKILGEPIERLDQTVFTFIVNSKYSHIKVMPVSESLITASRYITWCRHGSSRPVPDKKEKIPTYMFNKPCKVII